MRYTVHHSVPVPPDEDQISQLWWGAAQSTALAANALPDIPYASSSSSLTQRASSKPLADRKPELLRRKRRRKQAEEVGKRNSMLGIMNNNIKTMKRVRHTHAKFAALGLTSGAANNDDGEGGGEAAVLPVLNTTGLRLESLDEDMAIDDGTVDERPWSMKGKRKRSGVDIGEEGADDCLQWMGGKVLEHAGFQGEFYLSPC